MDPKQEFVEWLYLWATKWFTNSTLSHNANIEGTLIVFWLWLVSVLHIRLCAISINKNDQKDSN